MELFDEARVVVHPNRSATGARDANGGRAQLTAGLSAIFLGLSGLLAYGASTEDGERGLVGVGIALALVLGIPTCLWLVGRRRRLLVVGDALIVRTGFGSVRFLSSPSTVFAYRLDPKSDRDDVLVVASDDGDAPILIQEARWDRGGLNSLLRAVGLKRPSTRARSTLRDLIRKDPGLVVPLPRRHPALVAIGSMLLALAIFIASVTLAYRL